MERHFVIGRLWFVVVIMVGYLEFLLIGVLVCRIVSLRRWVVLWVKVMPHGRTKCILRVVFVGDR